MCVQEELGSRVTPFLH